MQDRDERESWALRPWATAAVGALAGIAIWLLIDKLKPTDGGAAIRAAMAAFAGAAATLFAFTFERVRPRWSILFSIGTALVVALIIYWNGPLDRWGTMEGWRATCVALSVAIAAPLFQTARDLGERRFPYQRVHGHAWTNVVIWFAAWAFAGLVFALGWLLAALFGLIGIDMIEDLLKQDWFAALLLGAALGGAVGLLRERDRIVGLLQRVVVSVLAVLAPVLGAGLLLFLASLPFTGLTPLWEATKSTTPILLSCVIGALILANAVIGNSDSEESRFPPLRWGALALAVAMLPFSVIAAVSTGARIAQYGFTPERLWALVFVVVATVYGTAYLIAVARDRLAWADRARRANLHIGFALCGLALFLATPLPSFNAISARDQVARLQSGTVKPEAFSWSALAFEFGDPGRRALEKLAKSTNPAIRTRAAEALKAGSRWDIGQEEQEQAAIESLRGRIRILPATVPLPAGLLEAFDLLFSADKDDLLTLIYRPGERSAVLVTSYCASCAPDVATVYLGTDGRWQSARSQADARRNADSGERRDARRKAARDALRDNDPARVEIRPVARRQLFIDGQPVGSEFE